MSGINRSKSFHIQPRQMLSAKQFVEGIKEGNRSILSRAITLVESSKKEHHDLAQEIVEACLPLSGNSVRIGITGVPGVGKSTFIEAFGLHLIEQQNKVCVLAIDPSSQRSRGSILGDKTRMEQLSIHPAAYIRPSPSAGALGGVANATRESIILCEAAGFNTILVETVGVGQSETTVHGMVDFFLLLMLSGAGDELQGIKRGIMEMADAILINKADGTNRSASKRAKREYTNALHLFPPRLNGWIPRVEMCSSIEKTGLDDAWNIIQEFHRKTKLNGFFEKNRQEQALTWLHENIKTILLDNLFAHPQLQGRLKTIEEQVKNRTINPYKGAQELLRQYYSEL